MKETIKAEGADFCWRHSRLLASVDIIEFQATEVYSSLDLTNVKYNMYIHSGDEKVKVMLQTSNSSNITNHRKHSSNHSKISKQ
jgi:hypothetical protein